MLEMDEIERMLDELFECMDNLPRVKDHAVYFIDKQLAEELACLLNTIANKKPFAGYHWIEKVSNVVIPPITPEDMKRLEAAMIASLASEKEGPGIPEARVKRDADGRIVRNPLDDDQELILHILDRRRRTRGQLWEKASEIPPFPTKEETFAYLRGEIKLPRNHVYALLWAASALESDPSYPEMDDDL
jgi:hypothetical protein